MPDNNPLLPYQAKIIQAMNDKTHNILVIEKGRRTGATWAVAAGKIIKAAKNKKDGGGNSLYIGPSLNMAREFISTCADWAKTINQALDIGNVIFDDESEKGVKAFRIDFASGNSIIALSSAPRSMRGFQGDVVIDEAAFHDDLNALMKAATAMVIWGSHITLISTHYGADNKFNEIVEDIKKGRLDYKLISVPFKKAVQSGLYRRICQINKQIWTQELEKIWVEKIYKDYGEGALEELDAIPSSNNNNYLNGSDIIACQESDIAVIHYRQNDSFKFENKQIRKEIIDNWCKDNLDGLLHNLDSSCNYSFGMDVARTSDLTVIWVLQELASTSYYTSFVIELRNMPYSAQQQILSYIIDKLPKFIGGAIDATGGGKETAERMAQKYGKNYIHEVTFSEKTYKELMPVYKKRLEDRTILIPKDRDIRDDHKLVVKVNGIPKIAKKRQGQKENKRHGDSVVACILAIHALDNAASNFEFFTNNEGFNSGDFICSENPFNRGYW